MFGLQLSQQDWLMCSGRDPTVRFNLTGLRLRNHGAKHKPPHRRGFSHHLNINPCPSDTVIYYFLKYIHLSTWSSSISPLVCVSVWENSLNMFPPAVNCPLGSTAQGQRQHWSTACSMILCFSLPLCITPLSLPPPPFPLVLWMHHVALNDLFYGCYVACHATGKGWLHVSPLSVDNWAVDSLQQHSAAPFLFVLHFWPFSFKGLCC